MNNILLILSTSRTSQDAIEYAVGLAKKEKAKLVVLYIIETELTNEVFDKFTDIGFIGDKPSTQLTEAIMKEYRQRGYEEMGKAQIRAMEENVDFDAVTTQGDFVEKSLEVIERYNVDTAVAVKRKRSAFLKYFSKSVVDELVEKAPCKVEVFEE
ncbi:MAG: universal stress protein [Deltaproteobacteria bacterium]|nr:universal stress protein [Deltaproteobacteria bacterium]